MKRIACTQLSEVEFPPLESWGVSSHRAVSCANPVTGMRACITGDDGGMMHRGSLTAVTHSHPLPACIMEASKVHLQPWNSVAYAVVLADDGSVLIVIIDSLRPCTLLMWVLDGDGRLLAATECVDVRTRPEFCSSPRDPAAFLMTNKEKGGDGRFAVTVRELVPPLTASVSMLDLELLYERHLSSEHVASIEWLQRSREDSGHVKLCLGWSSFHHYDVEVLVAGR